MRPKPSRIQAAGIEPFPLDAAHAGLSRALSLGGQAGRSLAGALGITPARLRELGAFYPDLLRPGGPSVCVGTSCFLAGGTAVADALPGAHRAHCLGHCDRSPCAASSSGAIHVACSPATVGVDLEAPVDPEPHRPQVRCRAPEPIITRNLVRSAVPSLDAARRRGQDMRALGLEDDSIAMLESRWGRTDARVRVSERMASGTAFLSFHHPETHANALTGPARDPESNCPEYKVTAVRVRPATS